MDDLFTSLITLCPPVEPLPDREEFKTLAEFIGPDGDLWSLCKFEGATIVHHDIDADNPGNVAAMEIHPDALRLFVAALDEDAARRMGARPALRVVL